MMLKLKYLPGQKSFSPKTRSQGPSLCEGLSKKVHILTIVKYKIKQLLVFLEQVLPHSGYS